MKTQSLLRPPTRQPIGVRMLLGLLLLPTLAEACPVCRPKVQAAIHTADYAATAGVVLLPVAVLLAVGLALYWAENLRLRRPISTPSPQVL